MNLIATFDRSSMCSATQTVPMPPLPRKRSSRYLLSTIRPNAVTTLSVVQQRHLQKVCLHGSCLPVANDAQAHISAPIWGHDRNFSCNSALGLWGETFPGATRRCPLSAAPGYVDDGPRQIRRLVTQKPHHGCRNLRRGAGPANGRGLTETAGAIRGAAVSVNFRVDQTWAYRVDPHPL